MDNEKLILKLIDISDAETLRDALVLCGELMEEDAEEVIDRKGNTLSKRENPENLKRALDYMLLIRRKCADLLRAGIRDV